MSLKEYQRRRRFEETPEPRGKRGRRRGPLRFVVQKHDASRTHYDFRLEIDGVLKSWAVPKGPSLSPHETRLAVKVEDHPMEYGSFEGVIPKGNYGAGTVMIWDSGHYVERSSSSRAESEAAMRRGLAEGHLTFVLHGEKLRGEFALVKVKKKGAEENVWLLVKKRDEHASRTDVTRDDRSTSTNRSMAQIAEQAGKKGELWLPGKGRAREAPARAASPMPHRVRAMEPAAVAKPPEGKGWLYEKAPGGLRAIAEVEKGRAHLYSRGFLSFDRKCPELLAALRALKRDLVLDGEIVTSGKAHELVVFDLLYADGNDLRERPLTERKKRLAKLPFEPPLRLGTFAESAAGEGMFVAKRADSRYHGGVSRDWVRFRARAGAKTALVESERPPVTHPAKVFWPDEGYTKGDLVDYYDRVAETILPHLVDRPQSLHRQPNGIRDEGFFHKDMTSYLPRRMETVRVPSGSSGRTINYVLCQDRFSLLYLANLGCIELNPWLSRRDSLDRPDFSVIDLDPDGNSFDEVVEIAREVHDVLESVGAEGFCKTSGSTGLHICVPTGARYGFDVSRRFAEIVCRIVHERYPALTSVERNPAKRRGRIYLDFMQNRRSQTLAAPYCVRPRAGATVSTPLRWSEVKRGLDPEAFNIATMARRIAKVGDLWKPLLKVKVDLEAKLKQLSRRFHIEID